MKILCQTANLFPMDVLSISRVIRLVAEAGYDGVEFTNISRHQDLQGTSLSAIDYNSEVARLCSEYGLCCHLHQVWGLKQNPELMSNRILHRAGLLPKDGSKWKEQFSPEMTSIHCRPIILYAEHIRERNCGVWPGKCNVWYQTCATHKNGQLSISYEELLARVDHACAPVVFDTVHACELRKGCLNVMGLPKNPNLANYLLYQSFKPFQKHVTEIHVCNYRAGNSVQKDRNCPLKEGVLDLKTFLGTVKTDGFNGYLVPEIQPSLSDLAKNLLSPVFRKPTLNRLNAVREELQEMVA